MEDSSFSKAKRVKSIRIKNNNSKSSGEKIIVDHYQLGDRIGKGAFGAVYKGLDIQTGSFVAIKRVPRRQGLDEAQLKNEMDLLKTFKHDNIVKYIDLILTENNVNIVLEYVESGSLAQVIDKFGVFPENLVAIYMDQVLKGLEYLHEHGVIHRDIKGPNLLITKDGVVKVADFGIAMTTKVKHSEHVTGTVPNVESSESSQSEEREPGSTDTVHSDTPPSVPAEAEEWSIVEGSPFWMAPEIIQMNRPSSACDIWSLGCTIIELVSGSPPYFDLAPLAALYKVVKEDHPPLVDNISPECKDFLLKCFQKDPSKRPSATDLRQHEWISKNVIRDKQGANNSPGPVEEKKLEKQIRRISQHNVDLELLNNEQWLAAMAEKWGDAANNSSAHVKSVSESVPVTDRSLKSHVLSVQDSAQKRSNSEGPNELLVKSTLSGTVPAHGGRVNSLPSALPVSPVLSSKQSRLSNQLQGSVTEANNDILLVIVDHEIRRNFLFKYVVYILKVYFNDQSWTITRSANDFKEFYEKLAKHHKLPPLPSHKFWKASELTYIQNKRAELQRFIDALLSTENVVQSKEVLGFITKKKNDK